MPLTWTSTVKCLNASESDLMQGLRSKGYDVWHEQGLIASELPARITDLLILRYGAMVIERFEIRFAENKLNLRFVFRNATIYFVIVSFVILFSAAIPGIPAINLLTFICAMPLLFSFMIFTVYSSAISTIKRDIRRLLTSASAE